PTAVTFLGMGTSLFAAHPAVCRLNALGIAARAVDASEYLYYHWEDSRPGLLRVLVSQSGESPEVKKVAARLAGKAPFVAITNDESSRLARAATAVLPLLAGAEHSTTNKTYINSLAAGLALAEWAGHRDPRGALEPLRALPQAMGSLLTGWRDAVGPLADFLGEPAHLDLIGRGPSLATVSQGSLILRELAHVKCAGMNAGLFRHGLVPSMRGGGLMLAFAPAGEMEGLTLGLVADVVAAGGRAVVVTTRSVPRKEGWFPVLLPPCGKLYAPFLEIVLVELLGLLYAERRGMEPGAGIPKITPKE
ncbi:MAG: SIS domain-containing protein, partial [bacterium]